MSANAFKRFFAAESAGGIALAMATVLALIVSNSPWSDSYEALRSVRGELRIAGDAFVLSKPLVVWVNDLWMAVFFLLVGLEIKRELIVGELGQARQALLPLVAALGGMAVPAGLYALINMNDPVALRGWAIPAATDIAFALGILLLLGSRVPASLKVFLTAVAIIDDLGAIVVIALFYTSQMSWPMLAAALAGCALLWAMNRRGVTSLLPYLAVGLIVWVLVLKSGVHATLAGVATAFAIPLKSALKGPLESREGAASPLETLEHALHPWIAFLVLPVFAFLNAGVSFEGMSLDVLTNTVPLGIATGLLVGKAIGVFGASWLLSALAKTGLPDGANMRQFFGVCVLCGVGFTMSLFIGGLAFAGLGAAYEAEVKLGVLAGSVVAGILGTLILMTAERRSPTRRRNQQHDVDYQPSRPQ